MSDREQLKGWNVQKNFVVGQKQDYDNSLRDRGRMRSTVPSTALRPRASRNSRQYASMNEALHEA